MDGLRSTQQQLTDEFMASFKRMTDPEERRKEAIKRRRNQFAEDLRNDAGL
jgi:hypothetical protein